MGQELLKAMQDEGADFTNTFRALSEDGTAVLGHVPEAGEWLSRWEAAGPDRAVMARANPAVIPRNHRIEQAIAAALEGDLTAFERLMQVLATPFTLAEADAEYANPPAEGERVLATFCGT